jgi:hypothetical protein
VILLNVITVTAVTIMSATPYSASSSSEIGIQYTYLCGYGQDLHSHATYKCEKKNMIMPGLSLQQSIE